MKLYEKGDKYGSKCKQPQTFTKGFIVWLEEDKYIKQISHKYSVFVFFNSAVREPISQLRVHLFWYLKKKEDNIIVVIEYATKYLRIVDID